MNIYCIVQCAEEVKRLWKLFIVVDATQVEINPLCETDDGNVVAVDAKIQFDDNAKFRQSKIFLLDETDELDPRERMASKFNLNYIGLDGNVGCLGKIYFFSFVLYYYVMYF